ncbi:hypothetical protein ABS315_27230 [Peribacillus frigoritolerans]|uniref:hypothetical protein n=1 Tax=Peribacillus frigoritolerans TaxID=450367 RepID=UPI0034E0BEFD
MKPCNKVTLFIGGYKPADEMTQEEIEAELEKMLEGQKKMLGELIPWLGKVVQYSKIKREQLRLSTVTITK